MAQYKYKPVKNDDTPQTEDLFVAIKEFKPNNPLEFVLGINKSSEVLYTDLSKLPHLLIGGTTGSGKSNFVHAIISCLIKNKPEDINLVLIDPKHVELSCYENLPHLRSRIATDASDAENLLVEIYEETQRRYSIFKKLGIKNINEYNGPSGMATVKLPRIVIIIDEIADILYNNDNLKDILILTAQISRAAGIHFIIATQRPSADIIDSRVKANFPARAAFKCASVQDSLIILGAPGAEKLQRAGDFLYRESGISTLIESKAIWIKSTHTPSMPAEVSNAANENIQPLIDRVSGINVVDFTEKYGASNVLKADVKAVIKYILLNKNKIINKDNLIDVIINGQIRERIIKILNHENILKSNGEINLNAIKKIITYL